MGRRSITIIAVCAAALPASAALAAAATHPAGRKLAVTPAQGTPKTHFAVAFVAPEPTGSVSGLDRSLQVKAAGPAGHGCTAAFASSPSDPTAGATVHVTMTPGTGSWCPGTYTGTVQEEGRPICHPGRPCPQFIALNPVGHFRFTVHAAR